jgi:hypothetical protein
MKQREEQFGSKETVISKQLSFFNKKDVVGRAIATCCALLHGILVSGGLGESCFRVPSSSANF